ncbi:unnamed protein product [Orchesella dallaii]|uniref:Gustatory receptor n=1 Tax=Orchesella dallaii TaxID=48710 RepID=A0ABP1PU11_9HEXA
MFLQHFKETETGDHVSTQRRHEDSEIPDHPAMTTTRRISTTNQVENLHCFCSNTFPIFQLTRLVGLNIVSTNHKRRRNAPGPRTDQDYQQANYCFFASFFSFPSLCNIFFATSYMYLTIWIYLYLKEHLGVFFQGVDYYTLAVDIVSNFAQATMLLFHARFKGKAFIKALHEMQNTYSCLKQQNPRFVLTNSIKNMSLGLVVFILSTTLIYGCLFLYLIFGMTIPYQNKNDSRHDWLSFSFIIQKFGHFLLPIYSQSFAALFIVYTEVVRQLYIQLARQLQLCLTNANGDRMILRTDSNSIHHVSNTKEMQASSDLSGEVESFRLLYERLFKTVNSLSDYFGGSLLVVCSIAVLSVTAAVYTIILNRSDVGIVRNPIVDFFFIVWGFHLFFALFILAGVLVSGQRVTCASRLIATIIQETSLKHIDKDSQFQINLLAQAVYGTSVEITACHITKMSMTFVASAVGNVITYILVLLQFRWSCSKVT